MEQEAEGGTSGKRYDATFKTLFRSYPDAWAALLGVRDHQFMVQDTDLSIVSRAGDAGLRVDFDNEDGVEHLEVQASYDPKLVERLILYHGIQRATRGVPAAMTLLLLRPEASGPHLTGKVEETHPRAGDRFLLDYRVMRVYEMDPEPFLAGGLGTLPLAVVARVAEADLPTVIARIEHRLLAEVGPEERKDLWGLIGVLLGLRMSAENAAELLRGVTMLKESSVYQAAYAEGEVSGQHKGRVEGQVETLLALGPLRFGPCPEVVEARLRQMDAAALTRLVSRVSAVESWHELLGA